MDPKVENKPESMTLTPIQNRLTGGERRSIGEAIDVANEVITRPVILPEIMDGLRSPDPILRSRSAQVVATVGRKSPGLLNAFKFEIMNEFAVIDQWEVREQMSKTIPQLDLNQNEVEEANLIFESYLRDKSSIVRTCAIQGLFDLLKFAPDNRAGPKARLEDIQFSGSAAMRARSRILLVKLSKMKQDSRA